MTVIETFKYAVWNANAFESLNKARGDTDDVISRKVQENFVKISYVNNEDALFLITPLTWAENITKDVHCFGADKIRLVAFAFPSASVGENLESHYEPDIKAFVLTGKKGKSKIPFKSAITIVKTDPTNFEESYKLLAKFKESFPEPGTSMRWQAHLSDHAFDSIEAFKDYCETTRKLGEGFIDASKYEDDRIKIAKETILASLSCHVITATCFDGNTMLRISPYLALSTERIDIIPQSIRSANSSWNNAVTLTKACLNL